MSATAAARRSLVLVIACAMALSLVATLRSPVRAAAFTVNQLTDGADAVAGNGVCERTAGVGDCTLRAAIEETNALAGADNISVPAGTYTLTLGYLATNDSVTITGAGAATTVIDGGGNDRVLFLDGDVAEEPTVNISSVTIRGGVIDDANGAGIEVGEGLLNLTSSVVTGNVGTSATGGGIFLYDDADAVLTGSTVTGNFADYGAGIFVSSGATLALNAGSIVSNNGTATEPAQRGGGINNSGEVTVTASSVRGNYGREGGGIFNTSDGTVTFVGGSLSDNRAVDATDQGAYGFGGGISSAGTFSFTNTTISGNTAVESGGGFQVDAGDGAITGSAITGNRAPLGGGILNSGDLRLLNSTVSGNTADLDGGGIYAGGGLEVGFSTIASNTALSSDSGGGIFLQAGASTDFYGAIIANNAPDDCFNNDGSFNSMGSNLDSDGSCELDQPGLDRPNTDPDLGPLADNGGPTLTHALAYDSPAVDAVSPAILGALPDYLLAGAVAITCPATDQRGVARPQDGDSDGVAVCDIGAYELLPPTASIGDQTVVEGDSGTVNAVFTVTLSRASTGTVTFAFATANDTATVVADYQAAAGTVTFAPGDVSETITVRVVGDTIDEPNETFFVNLSAAVGGTILDGQGVGTILDDEGPIVTPAPTPAAAQLPNTGAGDAGLGGPVLAIGLLAVSAAAWLQARRRFARGR